MSMNEIASWWRDNETQCLNYLLLLIWNSNIFQCKQCQTTNQLIQTNKHILFILTLGYKPAYMLVITHIQASDDREDSIPCGWLFSSSPKQHSRSVPILSYTYRCVPPTWKWTLLQYILPEAPLWYYEVSGLAHHGFGKGVTIWNFYCCGLVGYIEWK